jgi:hypothetical protein
MSEPISPDDVVKEKELAIPEDVFRVVNELIVENWHGSSASFCQDEIVKRLKAIEGFPAHDIFNKGWLDFEPVYRRRGWIVEYDKPGYNETYPATFEFRKKRKNCED